MLRNAGLLVAALLSAVAFSSCRARSDREAVAAVLEDLAARVEKKDVEGLLAHLAGNYRDFEDRDRAATRAMAEEYFRRYRGIKIKLLAARVEMGTGGAAAAEFDVSLYSGIGAALRKAVGFSGENYRVSCRFRREGAWRISEARWESIALRDMFPESLTILREIFPDL
jgi:hypothetical protein